MSKKSGHTPLFRQWESIKKQYPEVLVLFRLGDFYELFGEDAQTGARELELVLTSRECGPGRRIPMCGIPHHALQRYLVTLVQKGYRVALADQVEDPKQAKGLVRREVTRVVSPGTVLEDELITPAQHNYLAAVAKVQDRYGVSLLEVSTGDFLVAEPVPSPRISGTQPLLATTALEPALAALLEEITRVQPAEIVLPPDLAEDTDFRQALAHVYEGSVTAIEQADWRPPAQRLQEFFKVDSLAGFGCEEMPAAQAAAALALGYVQQNRLEALPHLQGLSTYSREQFMVIDATTRRNLELVRTLREGSTKGSLLWLIDRTHTPMGARRLRDWLLQPLLSPPAIEQRLDAVEELLNQRPTADRLREQLKAIYDLERLISRAATGTANARDLRALADSLQRLPELQANLAELHSELLGGLAGEMDGLQDLAEYLDRAITQEPPVLLTEGGLIRQGFSEELDELHALAAGGRQWIAELQDRERVRTGIKSLKVGFNKVFGYYLEVSKPNLHLVPEDYQRKQTLVNAERFITPEFKEQEAKVLGAEERSQGLEYDLFVEVRAETARHVALVQRAALAIAVLDALQSLAQVALDYNYARPQVNDSDRLEIIAGRHPLVEHLQTDEPFVPNDAHVDCEENQLLVITGPNMAGKSTYLRQVALICLLAQMGSFVPASEARLGLVDRIFTRVGASDDLATGQSTFMVEMIEAANILHNATDRSLIILDEIGRGTSTFDGLSLAWAVAEYIVRQIRAKTLFATHYHHLNELAEVLPRVKNYRIAVKEKGDDIIFLRRIEPGGTDRSYGIQVARLAGLPAEVIDRAREVLRSLEQEDVGKSVGPTREAVQNIPTTQLQLFESAPDPIVEELKSLDPDQMTPIEALQKLKELWEKSRER